jgi:outer membrane protein
MTMQRRTLPITAAFFLLFLYHSVTAQTPAQKIAREQSADSLINQISSGPAVVYSIQQCIDSALKNNPVVKTADFTAQGAKIQRLQQIGYMLPTLSSVGQFYNSGGKSVNTYNNTYITENYNQGYGNFSGSVALWNGGSIQNLIRQYSLAYQADKKDWQYQKDLITITIILDYLSILSAGEQLDLAIKQAADIRHRQDLMSIQDSLGSIAPSAFTDQKALLNSSELTIVNNKNLLEQNKLRLAQDMNIPYSPNLDVVKLNIDLTPAIYDASVDQIYQKATKNIASVQAAELHVASAAKGVKAERGNMMPTLSFFYQVQTQYSSAATSTAFLGSSYTPDGSYALYNGAQIPVYSQQGNYGPTKAIPLNTQFKNNVYTDVGLQLSIPILNHLNYRVLYKQSKVNLDQAIFNQKTINATLRQAVEVNYVTMTQDFRTFNVTYHEVENYEESYREAQIKYDAGALASLDFVIYNTNKNQAELALIQAKYQYLLATKILDYYQGQLTW